MTKGGGWYLQSGRACPSRLLGDGNLPPKCPSAYLQSGWEAGRWVSMAPCPSAYLQSGWEAGRWVAASSNPLRPRFVLSSPCAKIRRDRCTGIAGCDFQADSDWRGMRFYEFDLVDILHHARAQRFNRTAVSATEKGKGQIIRFS